MLLLLLLTTTTTTTTTTKTTKTTTHKQHTNNTQTTYKQHTNIQLTRQMLAAIPRLEVTTIFELLLRSDGPSCCRAFGSTFPLPKEVNRTRVRTHLVDSSYLKDQEETKVFQD